MTFNKAVRLVHFINGNIETLIFFSHETRRDFRKLNVRDENNYLLFTSSLHFKTNFDINLKLGI